MSATALYAHPARAQQLALTSNCTKVCGWAGCNGCARQCRCCFCRHICLQCVPFILQLILRTSTAAQQHANTVSYGICSASNTQAARLGRTSSNPPPIGLEMASPISSAMAIWVQEGGVRCCREHDGKGPAPFHLPGPQCHLACHQGCQCPCCWVGGGASHGCNEVRFRAHAFRFAPLPRTVTRAQPSWHRLLSSWPSRSPCSPCACVRACASPAAVSGLLAHAFSTAPSPYHC